MVKANTFKEVLIINILGICFQFFDNSLFISFKKLAFNTDSTELKFIFGEGASLVTETVVDLA